MSSSRDSNLFKPRPLPHSSIGSGGIIITSSEEGVVGEGMEGEVDSEEELLLKYLPIILSLIFLN